MPTKKKADPRYRNRIVGQANVDPSQLLANPRNPRVHPAAQQDAMGKALEQVGWIQRVVVNKRTGHVIDGHLRVEMALSAGEPSIPVTYVDLSEEEERLALVTFDALGGMALVDEVAMADLLNEITAERPEMASFMQEIADAVEVDMIDPKPLPDPKEATLREQWHVLVVCDSESAQINLLEELQREGYECRALIS
jgi:hypothetical protein